MTGEQLLFALRRIKEVAEHEIGSKCDVSLYVDRNAKEGLMLEIKHKLGNYDGDGLTYCLRIDAGDNFTDGLDVLTLEVVSWVKEQRSQYLELLKAKA